MNNSSQVDGQSTLVPPHSVTVSVITLMVIAISVGTLGNARVCLVLRERHALRKVSMFLHVSLSVTGIMSSLLNMPALLAMVIVHYLLDRPVSIDIFCEVGMVSTLGLNAVYCLTLSIMAIDRHDCVVHPFNRRFTPRNIKIVVLVIWIVALVLSSVSAVMLAKEPLVCSAFDPYNPSYPQDTNRALIPYMTASRTTFNMSTILVIIVTFFRIVKRLRSSSLPESKSLHQRYENQLTKTTFKLCSVFLVFWLPVILCSVVSSVGNFSGRKIGTARLLTIALANFSYVANPFLHWNMLKTRIRPVLKEKN